MKSRAVILLLALIAILLFGAARLWPELRIANEERAAHFHQTPLTINLRDQIGQSGFLAALSGFRAAVADILWIQAETAWERVEWGKMDRIFQNVTTLQPRSVMFWNMAAYQMAYNASVAALDDSTQPRLALRLKAQREYWDIGRDFLLRGIANNPKSFKLCQSLAFIYRDKYHDHCKAAEYFQKAAGLPNPFTYLDRFAAYELAACPGHDREAFDRLRALYDKGKQEREPTLVRLLNELGKKLKIPPPPGGYVVPPKP